MGTNLPIILVIMAFVVLAAISHWKQYRIAAIYYLVAAIGLTVYVIRSTGVTS